MGLFIEGMKQNLIKYWLDVGIVKDKRIIDAFEAIPREKFVLKEYEEDAYADYALPILKNQTISQPSTIMVMLQALEPKPADKVIEIGAGSGYNAALLSKVVKEVYSVEIIEELVKYAKENIEKLGIKNVSIVHGDGSLGYADAAPYDKAIITAACAEIPKPIIEQVKDGGIIVAPVGPLYSQKMFRCVKSKGKLEVEVLGDFVFVPLKGKFGR